MPRNALPVIPLALVLLLTSLARSADREEIFERKQGHHPKIRKQIDRWIRRAVEWAADPVVVKAVKVQNRLGPISNMTQKRWHWVREDSVTVKSLKEHKIFKEFRGRLEKDGGLICQFYVSAEKGEKVAMLVKPGRYSDRGLAKFDFPFETGIAYLSPIHYDLPTQVYSIEIAVPVVDPAEHRRIGVMVIGLKMSLLEVLAGLRIEED